MKHIPKFLFIISLVLFGACSSQPGKDVPNTGRLESSGWSTWNPLPGITVLSRIPTVGQNADGRLEVFVEGPNTELWHIWQGSPSGGWAPWQSLQRGQLEPHTIPDKVGSAIRNQDGRLEVFYQKRGGETFHSWQKERNGVGGWTGDERLLSPTYCPASAGRNADGRLEVFVCFGVHGSGVDVAHAWQTLPNGPEGWLSGHFQNWHPDSMIYVAYKGDGRLEIFSEGDNGALWSNWQRTPNGTGGWSGWSSIGAPPSQIYMTVGVDSNADGRLEAFVIGKTDGALWHKWQTSLGGEWTDWTSLGIPPNAATGGAGTVGRRDGRLEVFVNGNNGLWHIWQVSPNGAWSSWSPLGSPTPRLSFRHPAVANNSDGRLEVFVIDSDGNLWHIWQTQ